MVILKNGKIVDPKNKINEKGDLWIKNGKIERLVLLKSKPKVSKNDEKGYKVIYVDGATISPGFIDIHVHLREPGLEYKEDILSGSKAAAAGGFTSVACMANTQPVNDNASVTKYIVDKAKSYNLINVFPIASVTKKMEGKELSEFGDIKDAGAVGFSDDGIPIMNSKIMRTALEYAKDFNLPIIEHCEDLNLKGQGVMHEGLVSCRLGLEGIPDESESIMVERNIDLARLTGGKLHLAHISCEKSIKAIKLAKEEGLDVTAEATPHHFTLTDKACEGYGTNTKMSPPLRTAKDVQAIKEAFASGILDAIASDHAPHAQFEKNVEFDLSPFGIVGLETTLSLSLTMVEQKVIDVSKMVEFLSIGPSKVLNLNRGTLEAGAIADVVVFDPDADRKIDPTTFFSKSENTPFTGFNLKGEILYTICGGRIVYQKGGEV